MMTLKNKLGHLPFPKADEYADKTVLVLRHPHDFKRYTIKWTFDLANDDESEDELQVDDIMKDELYFLVLCYIFDDNIEFCGAPCHTDEEFAVCGVDFENDINFSWLGDYLRQVGLIQNSYRLPIKSIYANVILFNEHEEYRVLMPDMNELFETREEMVEHMNKLYNDSLRNW